MSECVPGLAISQNHQFLNPAKGRKILLRHFQIQFRAIYFAVMNNLVYGINHNFPEIPQDHGLPNEKWDTPRVLLCRMSEQSCTDLASVTASMMCLLILLGKVTVINVKAPPPHLFPASEDEDRKN